jgi:hypothetical protein
MSKELESILIERLNLFEKTLPTLSDFSSEKIYRRFFYNYLVNITANVILDSLTKEENQQEALQLAENIHDGIKKAINLYYLKTAIN